MKRLLGILGATGLVAASASSVVACGNKTNNEVRYTYLYDINIVNNWIFDNFSGAMMMVNPDKLLIDINNFDFFWSYWSGTFNDLRERIGEDQFLTFKEYIKINLWMFFNPYELTWRYDEFKTVTIQEFTEKNTVDGIFLGVDPDEQTTWFNKNLGGNIRHFEIRIKIN